MAKKDKNKNKALVAQNAEPELVARTVVEEPEPVYEAIMPDNVPKWVVNCHRCGAGLHVQEGNMVFMCPVCNNLFRVRKCEKLVKDVSRVVVAEAYVNVHKGRNE